MADKWIENFELQVREDQISAVVYARACWFIRRRSSRRSGAASQVHVGSKNLELIKIAKTMWSVRWDIDD